MSWYIAVDVETANRNKSSICQIGLVAFEAGVAKWEWASLVNPEEDRACGEICARAITDTGHSLDQLTEIVGHVEPSPYSGSSKPNAISYREIITLEGNPSGPLAGHELTMTGDFLTPRANIARAAADMGCKVRDRFGKRTTIVIVGHRDPILFAGKMKSNKLLDAEAAILSGRTITILSEQQFIDLARRYQGTATA